MAFSLGGLFGGNKGPAFDPTPLRNMLKQSADRQKEISTGLTGKLQPFGQQLETKTAAAGQGFVDNTKALSDRLTAGAVNPAATNAAIGAKQEQEFRAVPQTQQAIRDALASGNRLATGRGAAQIARPVVTAAQNTSDFGSALNLQNEQNRQDNLKQGVTMEQQAGLTKLGLDSDTIRTLFETGRGDIVQEAASLLGIESDLSQGLFDLDIAKFNADSAAAQNSSSNRMALVNALIGGGATLAGSRLSRPTPVA